jgi:hypothetical protein
VIKFLISILLFLPFLVLADTYQNDAGAAQMAGDFFTDIWTFLDTDLPDFLVRMWAFIVVKYFEITLYAKIELLKLAWSVSKQILENYQIVSKITAKFNLLPPDIRQAIVDMRLLDAVSIIVNAYLTRFVMRFF